MKKIFLQMVIIILVFITLPNIAFAGVFKEKDARISLNEVIWEVITKDGYSNIKEKWKYEEAYKFLLNFDAFLIATTESFSKENPIAIILTRKSSPFISNLHTYDNVRDAYTGDYTVINNDYTYIYEEDKLENDVSAIRYTTVINQEEYIIEARSKGQFTDLERKEVRNIVDGISFNVDSAYNKETNYETYNEDDIDFITVFEYIGKGLGYFVIFSGIIWVYNEIKKKEN